MNEEHKSTTRVQEAEQSFVWFFRNYSKENSLRAQEVKKTNPAAAKAMAQLRRLVMHPSHTKSPGAAAPAPPAFDGKRGTAAPQCCQTKHRRALARLVVQRLTEN